MLRKGEQQGSRGMTVRLHTPGHPGKSSCISVPSPAIPTVASSVLLSSPVGSGLSGPPAATSATPAVASSDGVQNTALESKKADGASDGVPLADSAKCKVYVCFEGR